MNKDTDNPTRSQEDDLVNEACPKYRSTSTFVLLSEAFVGRGGWFADCNLRGAFVCLSCQC